MFRIEQNSPLHLKTGKIGEDIACKYLIGKGYTIIERNFRRKWGEIDIICSKNKNNKSPIWNNKLSALKNVLCETLLGNKNKNVLCGTKEKKIVFVEVKTLKNIFGLKPEDNLTYFKQKKLIRTCQLYISEKNIDQDTDWQIDAVLIEIDSVSKKAKIKHVESAIY